MLKKRFDAMERVWGAARTRAFGDVQESEKIKFEDVFLIFPP